MKVLVTVACCFAVAVLVGTWPVIDYSLSLPSENLYIDEVYVVIVPL